MTGLSGNCILEKVYWWSSVVSILGLGILRYKSVFLHCSIGQYNFILVYYDFFLYTCTSIQIRDYFGSSDRKLTGGLLGLGIQRYKSVKIYFTVFLLRVHFVRI